MNRQYTYRPSHLDALCEGLKGVPQASYKSTSDCWQLERPWQKSPQRAALFLISDIGKDRMLCEQNRQIYKMLHGYDVHFFTDAAQILPNKAARMNVKDGVHKPFFWKVNLWRGMEDAS